MASEPLIKLLDATSPARARALAHPTRHRLLREIDQNGATVSQLANRLLINKGNVAHHIGVLVDAGLLRKGLTRTVRGGTEQYYVRVAEKVHFEHGPDGAATAAMMSSLARDISRDPHALLNHRVLRLTARQASALAAALDATVNGLEPAGERERRYGVVVGVHRYAGR
jgi:DNA-binding transcriptional ArsR family regulator